MVRSGQAKEHPHAEQSEPGKHLNKGELLHRLRHVGEGAGNLSEQLGHDLEYFCETRGASISLAAHPFELFHVLRRIFFRREDGPQHCEQENNRADLERVLHRERNAATRSSAHAKLPKHPGQCVCQRGADADEETLHHEADGSLLNI